MNSLPHLIRACLVACMAAGASLACAQGFAADYSLERFASPTSLDAGLSLQRGRNWFGQVGLAQGPVSPLNHAGTNDILNIGGGYRWSDGQSLSLQVSRGRGPGQRLGLAFNYDWPHYFVRFSYDPQGLSLSPQDSLRLSAGVRF
ncbi:MAG TPA: hypothetical protein VMZ74_14510 [Ramlibacter sp.]|nr:hypothetical protein [Ramlibacter sp.]